MSRRPDLQLVVTRYLGLLPKGASESVRLRWLRRVSLRIGLPSLLVTIVVLIVINVTWLYVLVGVMVVLWGTSIALTTRDISRAEKAERGD
jgi:hypothetical protein